MFPTWSPKIPQWTLRDLPDRSDQEHSRVKYLTEKVSSLEKRLDRADHDPSRSVDETGGETREVIASSNGHQSRGPSAAPVENVSPKLDDIHLTNADIEALFKT